MNVLEKNKATVTRFVQALCGGDAETVKNLITRDLIAATMGTSVYSREFGYSEMCEAPLFLHRITKSGIACTFLSLTAEEDRVSCEMQGHSTLVNGIAYNNQYHFLFVLRDCKICKMKEYLDTKLIDTVVVPLVQTGIQ